MTREDLIKAAIARFEEMTGAKIVGTLVRADTRETHAVSLTAEDFITAVMMLEIIAAASNGVVVPPSPTSVKRPVDPTAN